MNQHHLDTRTIQLVQESWHALESLGMELADRCFQRLFTERPDLARFFPSGNTPAQRARLVSRITMVVDSLDRLEEIRVALEVQAQYAARLGVWAEDYRGLRSIWLQILRGWPAPVQSEEAIAAWSVAYDVTTRLMVLTVDRIAAHTYAPTDGVDAVIGVRTC